jgi:hypothetical protein
LSQNGIEPEHSVPSYRACGERLSTADRRGRWAWSQVRRPRRRGGGGIMEARCGAVRGRSGSRGRVGGGLGTCHAATTCVRDRAPGEGPDGRRGSSSVPGCGPTSEVIHSTRAGRTKESEKSEKIFLLRDHAPPQLLAFSVVAAERRRAGGAHVVPWHAGLWPHRPGAVWPAAAPPASGGADAGNRGPGSNAGSNAAAGSGGHSLCAGRSAAAVVADSYNGGRLCYHDAGPRECVLPRVSPGRTRYRSPRALIQTGSGRSYDSLCFPRLTRQRRKRFEKSCREGDDQAVPDARSPVHPPRAEPDSEGNNLRNA